MNSALPIGRLGRVRLVAVAIIAMVVIAVALAVWLVRSGGAGRGGVYVEGSPEAALEDISRAVAKVAPAVVRIDTTAGGGPEDVLRGFFGGSPEGIFPRRGQGSGVIINRRRGYVLTNAHVVRDARRISVALPDGRVFEGNLLGADAVTDIAVVQIKGGDLPEVELGSSEKLPVGSWVIAVGSPFALENTVTAGVVSAKGRTIVGEGRVAVTDLLQTDAAINRGNSGGALIDLRGQVVGMPTAIVPFAQGIGFAVASDTAMRVVPELVDKGRVSHAWLGIAYKEAPDEGGVVLEQVMRDSPAARAGLEPDDVIVAMAGKQIRRRDDVARVMHTKRARDKLELTILRGGARRTINVVLAEMPRFQ